MPVQRTRRATLLIGIANKLSRITMRTIKWKAGTVFTIDQTQLPNQLVQLEIKDCSQMAFALKKMKIRGAPLIGIAAAYGLALTAYHSKAQERETLIREITESAKLLRKTRPTAVNLFWATDHILKKAEETSGGVYETAKSIIDEAQNMADKDVEINQKIGEHGCKLVEDGDVILTHCNAGTLATVNFGTALGVIRAAWTKKKRIKVIATETRPKLQGTRLTAYELKRDGIPVTLITDNMVGYVMYKKLINRIIVGADRIVRDAVINKIGTYTIAVLAHENNIPFYVAAPKSTFDLDTSSKDVIIEERDPEEITYFCGKRISPSEVTALNPAFDITPIRFVNAIICETGIHFQHSNLLKV